MRRLAAYIAWFAGISFFASLGYFAHLARISPTSPDSASGHIVRMNDHGYYFYVHPWQAWILNFSPFASVALFFVIAATAQYRNWNLESVDVPQWARWAYL